MTPEGLTALADVGTPSNPFPGLRPFEFGESHLYFGRDGQSDQLIRKLAATRFVAVVGTSGSGKSSLVRAGLLPDLFSGFMSSAGSHWRVALMRPGNDPLGNLTRALCSTEVFGSEIEENARIQEAVTEATLRRGGLGLVEAVRQNRMASNESLLVVVDQFEELFRFARVAASEQYRYEAAAFVKLLLEAARQREQNIYVVLTMRSDFLGDCSIFWDLPEAINEGQYLIPRMTRDQRAEAITGPVAVCGGRIEQRLVNRLLNDMGDNPDLLPILQHALMRTWENWAADHAEGEAVDLRHYEAVGTMSDALSRHADEAFNELRDERSKQIAERVFKALTEKGEDNREVRRPTVLKDLCALTGAAVREVVPVIEVFRREGRSFLMPPAALPLDEESLIDISHESLIRNWGRLKGWVDEESQSAQIYTRLAETAVLHERGQAGLWRDPDLQLALDWRERTSPTSAWGQRYHPSFDASMSFLDASVNARDAAALEEERRRLREIRRTRVAAVIFFLLFMLSLAALTYANVKRNEAQEKSDAAVAALADAEAANARAEAALADAVRERDRANQQSDIAKRNEEIAKGATDEALKEKKAAEQAKADAVKSAEVARLNARRAEVSRLEAEKQKVEAEKQRGEAEKQKSNAQAEATKSRRLLYASDMSLAQQAYDNGNVAAGRELLDSHRSGGGDAPGFEWFYLWNLFHGDSKTQRFGGAISSMSVLDGGRILAVNAGGEIALTDRNTGKVLMTVRPGDIKPEELAFSPDGRTLAFKTGGPNPPAVKVVATATGESFTLQLGDGPAEVTALAFSPDGKMLATGTSLEDKGNSEVTLWDFASRRKVSTFEHESTVISIAFSPDGRDIAAAGLNGLVMLWDAASKAPCMFRTNVIAYPVLISPDGSYLAVGSMDGRVWVWTARCHEDPKTAGNRGVALSVPGYSSPITAMSFSPDGKLLAVSHYDNTMRVWNFGRRGVSPSLEPEAAWKGHVDYIGSVAFLPDNRTLLSGSMDGTISEWNTAGLTREQTPLGGHVGAVFALAYSPDGSRIATGGVDKSVLLWDAETGQRIATPALKTAAAVRAIAFSPGGKLVAVGDEHGTLKLLDAGTYETVGSLEQGRSPEDKEIFSAAFSPDSKRLVACGRGGIWLWDVDARALLKAADARKNFIHVAYSPDGKWIAAGDRDGQVNLWDASLSDTPRPFERAGGTSSSVSRLAFSNDGRLLAAAFFDGTVVLWDAASRKELASLRAHRGSAFALAFSPDDGTLATGGTDSLIKLWATNSFKELIALRGHKEPVMALAFSPDGRTLASTSFDKTVRLWRAASREKAEAGGP